VFLNGQGLFETLVMRRQVDHRFVVTQRGTVYADADHATVEVSQAMRPDGPPEPLAPGQKKRAALVPRATDGLGDIFRLLVTTIQHYPALMAIGETYHCKDNSKPRFKSCIIGATMPLTEKQQRLARSKPMRV
jgi:hypothetical protein